MDIACPNCAATYRVPEALIAQGKPLRCAACGEVWVPQLPAAPASPEVTPATGPALEPPPVETAPDETPAPKPAPAEPEAAASDAPPAAGPPPTRSAAPTTPPPLNPPVLRGRSAPAAGRGTGGALRLAWAASIATVLLALAGLVLYGDAIAAAWPPFARVTALLGG